MIEAPLDEAQRRLLADERELLAELEAWLQRLGSDAEKRRALASSLAQLEQPFLVVVVGEFNAGKSAFINALLGQAVLEEGVTPTTSRIGLVRHGRSGSREVLATGVEAIEASSEVLRDLVFVDTPGTNAVLREHEALTRDFVPRADLVVFLTSADRPFTESERAFLEAVRQWGKKVVVVLNKADLLRTPEELERVVAYVREQALRTLDLTPEVFPVSARLALAARLDGEEDVERSGLPAFEARVTATLDEKERFRLKLLNPLGVGLRVRDDAEAVVRGRLQLLAADVSTLDRVDADLRARAEDQSRDFTFRLSDAEKVLLEFERRGHAFFDDRLRLSRLKDLLSRDRLRADFEKEVVADLPRQVEGRVEDIVDWMVGQELRQWQDVMGLLSERQAAHADRLVGRVDGRFEYDRQRLLEAVSSEARREVADYDAPAESKRLAQDVRDSVAQTALLQVSALGIGAAVAALATTTVADVTGILAAGAVSVIGFFVLPARRRKARTELAARVATMRSRILASLTASFERERERGQQRVREAIAPYARFVRGEQASLKEAETALVRLGDALSALQARVDAPAAASPSASER